MGFLRKTFERNRSNAIEMPLFECCRDSVSVGDVLTLMVATTERIYESESGISGFPQHFPQHFFGKPGVSWDKPGPTVLKKSLTAVGLGLTGSCRDLLDTERVGFEPTRCY